MLIDLDKEVVPAFDQLAFFLVPDELKLIFSPAVFDVTDDFLQDQLTSCLVKEFCHDLVVLDKISLPEIVKNLDIEFEFDFQLG